ncbi:hypothetical protein GCM10022252_15740 [Streptosporangium oxazolinicum]|uniref:Phosphatidic acid phosphatase type 2/haloperoxidase domain-containing protein n=1 Tax=Streptosporangium oxazolinicum TaxID=909287 RepID=A0ABP8AL16_9ACTN
MIFSRSVAVRDAHDARGRKSVGSAPRGRGLDERLLAIFTGQRRTGLVSIAHTVTHLGSPTLMGAQVAALAAGTRDWRLLAVYVSGLATRHQVASVIDRARPPREGWRETPIGPSFPSRHTTTALLGTLLITERLTGSPGRAAAAGIAVGGAVGVSRLLLGVHWPSDVAGGAVFAYLWWALFGRRTSPLSTPLTYAPGR